MFDPDRPAEFATFPLPRHRYEWWDDALLDAGHPVRIDMTAAGIDRLILAEAGVPEPGAIGAMRPNAT